MNKAVISIIFLLILGESCYSKFLHIQPPYSWRCVHVKLLQVAVHRVQCISIRSNPTAYMWGLFYNLDELYHLHMVYHKKDVTGI